MLTLIPRINVWLFLTSIGSTSAEKLFHSRDRSDVKISYSHQAELVTDKNSAEIFLSRYGFVHPVNWGEVQFKETPGDPYNEDFAGEEDLLSWIQEGDSSVSRAETDSDAKVVSMTTESPAFISALREFQEMSGLPVTGLFDDATKAAMNTPRCGVPDKETGMDTADDPQDNVSSSAPEMDATDKPHNHLTSSAPKIGRREVRGQEWGHMAFSKTVLKWRLIGEGYSSQLTIEDQRQIFGVAFRMWSEVTPLEFVEDTRSPLEDVDIRLGFGTGRHLGCNQKFDGTGREFAHAWFLGDIHFDDDEHFTAPNTGSGISLLKVAVHEIGHVLGLPHIYRTGSIMQPSYLPQESGFEMDWTDRKAIQHLYGGCSGRFNTVFDWIRKERTQHGEAVVRFNTYFMRDGWYWLYENRNNRTRYGDPVALQVGWHGIPTDGVDACVHVWNRKADTDAVYFFKGTQYWRYDNDNDRVFTVDPEGHHYPRPISEGFPGIPSPIDTVFYDRRDSHMYFFRGTNVYAFSVAANRLSRGFPRKITAVFPALTSGDHPGGNIDAAYFSYTHNAVFLFKDTRFWRVVGGRDRQRRPFQPRNGLMPHREVEEQWFDICNVHPSALKVARR
uniref:Peptidase metallopeptidase domain-containing protein n=1 Tax=Esox lucius TaxID=8010 RepID=A0A6Q2YXS1_ESOLU